MNLPDQSFLDQLDLAIAGTKDVVLSRDEAALFKRLLLGQRGDVLSADTGEDVTSLAGRFLNFERSDLILAACDRDDSLRIVQGIRCMAASCLRQDERP